MDHTVLISFAFSLCVMYTLLQGRRGELDTTETLAHAFIRPNKTIAHHTHSMLAEGLVDLMPNVLRFQIKPVRRMYMRRVVEVNVVNVHDPT